ncbi:nucleoside phosphorylase [Rufibacter glacialis]|uniref:Uridine phosphorylase n=1 Tax=Rufibacter glacialis TaxID=1259555 RepID=A0A5M8QLD8_9BACT|nr:nucleoside phosphorylase [Rufibacter glacialis]KAA6435586.1 phosphorylase [Rufibacter glacialis]GGK64759.1 phosphorylase [Rufibacter glacialis]
MARIPESELILNPDGSIYHLNLLPEQISDTIITVGDQDRVARVSRHFDSLEVQVAKREFVTHTGYYKGKRISVVSTGIGTDNIDIVMNELDALVNIDFVSREALEAEDRISLRIVRIGTSGALQQDVPLGSHLATEYAVGLDTLMQFYPLMETGYETEIAVNLQLALGLGFLPYCAKGSDLLREQIAFDMIHGHTFTCPGFYAPQGRLLRLQPKIEDVIQKMSNFRFEDVVFTNFEMETAGIYSLGRLLGHEVLSLNAIVANRINHQFAPNPEAVVDDLIVKVLDRI